MCLGVREREREHESGRERGREREGEREGFIAWIINDFSVQDTVTWL